MFESNVWNIWFEIKDISFAFINIEQLTQQTKKAMGEATKSVQEASKTALEASKTAAGVSKNTLDDLTYVGKSTFGDLTKSAKEVAAKKGLLKVRRLPQLINNLTNVPKFDLSQQLRLSLDSNCSSL